MDKGQILDGVQALGEQRILLANLLDRAAQSNQRNSPISSEFLSPAEQALARQVLQAAGIGQHQYCFWGGYPQAERCVAVFLPDWMEPEQVGAQAGLVALRATFREPLTHRDFLGSLMALGIQRPRIGDILVEENQCDLVVSQSMGDYLVQSWESAGRVKLSVQRLELEALCVPEQKVQEIRDTVMSLRLDAVASSGFRTSRSKMGSLITGGKVRLNDLECSKSDKPIAQGDVISVRGLGKMKVEEVGCLSKKGRTNIVLKRYL